MANARQRTDPFDNIELPQEIIDSYARFLIPELRKFYDSDEGKQALAKWQEEHEKEDR